MTNNLYSLKFFYTVEEAGIHKNLDIFIISTVNILQMFLFQNTPYKILEIFAMLRTSISKVQIFNTIEING